MRGWRRVWIVLAALVALLVAALALWPASLAIAWFAPENSPLRYGGVQGTVWSGRLSGASVSGLRLGDVDWTLSPWSLLLRRPQVALRFSGDLDGRAGLRREGGVVALDDVELRFPARWLEPALDLPGMSLTGRVVLTVPRGTVHGVLLADLQGTAVWLDAGMRGAANAALGEFGAEFASTPLGGLAGRVEDRAGPLGVVPGLRERLATEGCRLIRVFTLFPQRRSSRWHTSSASARIRARRCWYSMPIFSPYPG